MMVLPPVAMVYGAGLMVGGTVAADTDPSSPESVLTSLGVFSVVGAVAYWFLKREDRKDAVRQQADAETMTALRIERDTERQRAEEERARAAALQQQLVELTNRIADREK